jgi:anaerobic ribonucleoside-triphosphate reductase
MNNTNSNNDLQPCPCCGSKTVTILGQYEICEVCGWEDDPVQSTDPDYAGGANNLSLNQAKKEWLNKEPRP